MICVGGQASGMEVPTRAGQMLVSIPAPITMQCLSFESGVLDSFFAKGATVEEYEVQLVDLRWDSARLQARALVHSSIKDRLQIQRAVLMALIAQALTTSAKEPPHG